MSTYIDGRRIRYPKPGDWACLESQQGDPERERGLITAVRVDGVVCVAWDEGDDWLYEPDTLFLSPTGWYWVVPDTEPEEEGWG